MTIGTYSTLITAVTEWLAREEDTTLIARIPDFIRLCEAKGNRLLFVPQMETRATATVNMLDTEPEFISLPNDFQSMRQIRLSSVAGKPPLKLMTSEQTNQARYNNYNMTGQPTGYAFIGNEIELFPTPSESVTLEMIYRATIPALSVDNPTNWLLSMAPDFYLYGTLLESAPYIKEDARVATWGAGLSSVMDGLNDLGFRRSLAGPSDITLPGVTP